MEYLTAVWFFLAGGLLFGTAWREPSLYRRCVYIIGGVAMVFAAGEEISWGQRIFGFATPDFLLPLNESKEFNVHNISNSTFDRIYRNGAFLLCLATSVAFFWRKDRLLGIPFPSILLTLGFLVVLSNQSGAFPGGLAGFILVKEKGLLLLLLIFALISRRVELAVAAIATLALVWALSYVNYHNVYYGSIAWSPRVHEVREYLFGIGCLFYALELALAQGRLAAIMPARLRGRQLPDGRIPYWLMTCSLVIVGSIGLMVFAYFNPMTATSDSETATRAEYAAVVSGEPLIRSDYDLYLRDNTLVYVKEPCARADTEAVFFLHLYPVDRADRPAPGQQHGFDNRDFWFYDWPGGVRGGIFDRKCMAAVVLPEYAIDRVSTGQFVPVEDGVKNLWEVEFPWKEGK